MEEADVRTGPTLTALAGKAFALAAVVFLIALGLRNFASAAGAAVGVLAAALYAWGYLGSHLRRLQKAAEERSGQKLFRQATVRLFILFLATGGMWFAGRSTFLGFLIGFAIGFAVIVVSEAPRITRTLRTRGLTG